MANFRASAPDRPQPFNPTAPLLNTPSTVIQGGGEAGAEIARNFRNLAETFGAIADKAAEREGASAGLSAGEEAQLPGGAGAPLLLKRDGTIRGEAFDAAAQQTFMARLDSQMRMDTATAFDENQYSPSDLAGALSKLKAGYLSTLPDDKELRGAFGLKFDDQAFAYRQRANALLAKRLEEQRQAEATTSLDASLNAIERQAFLTGTQPGGAPAFGRESARFASQVDYLRDHGVLTPNQAEGYKQDLKMRTLKAQMKGAADNLDPDARDAYADQLVDHWKAGGDQTLSLDQVEGVAGEIRSGARHARVARGDMAAEARASSLSAAADDVASIRTTGFSGVDADKVAAGLTPTQRQNYLANRAAAHDFYAATGDMAQLPPNAIAGRLAALQPAPGSAGFASREKVAVAAKAEAARILKQRQQDPAAAVDAAFPSVATLKTKLDEKDPATFRALASARLAAQAQLGLGDYERDPLTDAEAKALAAPISRAAPDARADVFDDTLKGIYERYGNDNGLADHVISQVVRQQGISRELADRQATIVGKLNLGAVVSRGEARSADAVADIWAAETATRGGSVLAPASAIAMRTPSRQDIGLLMSNPEKYSAMFDQTFGRGAADRALARPTP